MTEAQARAKPCIGPCPSNTGVYLRATDARGAEEWRYYCAGSACLAWRWEMVTHYANGGAHVSGHSISSTNGYCSFAGKPEAMR